MHHPTSLGHFGSKSCVGCIGKVKLYSVCMVLFYIQTDI